MSEPSSVVALMIQVMRDVTSISKTDTNSHFGFKFRGIDTVLEHIGPALRSRGILVIPELRSQTTLEAGKNNRVIVEVAYTFYGPSGDSITAVVPGEAMDAQDKASSKAMSVAFRTVLLQAFSIPTGERDPHAGPPVSTKLARIREEVKKVAQQNGWSNEQLFDEYTQWSRGAEIGAADETDLQKFLDDIQPKRTMQRSRPGAKP